MSAMASQITGVSIICSTFSTGVDERKPQSSVSEAFLRETTSDWWIPLTKVQWRGKCFHFMTSSWRIRLWKMIKRFLLWIHFCWITKIIRQKYYNHDDVIKWKHCPRYWPFVRGIHRSPVNSPHKGQWRGTLVFTLICARINGWINNRQAGDLRRYRTHYDVIVMSNAACVSAMTKINRVTWGKRPSGQNAHLVFLEYDVTNLRFDNVRHFCDLRMSNICTQS